MFSLWEDDHLRVADQTPLPQRGEVPVPLPRSSSLPGKSRGRTTSGNHLGGFRIMLRTSSSRN